jgi:TRAP-type C4-dicarboxylate transport system permease small subunit
MEASMAWFYAAGLMFSIFAFVFILNDFWKLVSGQLADDELVGIIESEEDVAAVEAAAIKH